jgi:hypothetical protein
MRLLRHASELACLIPRNDVIFLYFFRHCPEGMPLARAEALVSVMERSILVFKYPLMRLLRHASALACTTPRNDE